MSRNSLLMSSPIDKHNFSAVFCPAGSLKAQQHCLNGLCGLQPDASEGCGAHLFSTEQHFYLKFYLFLVRWLIDYTPFLLLSVLPISGMSVSLAFRVH